MDLLRDPAIVAMNDVIRVLNTESARLATTLEGPDDIEPDLAGQVSGTIEACRTAAESLSDIIRNKDDVPDSPSDESLLLDQAGVLLRSAISDDAVSTVQEELNTARQRIADAVADALPEVSSPEAKAILQSLID